MNGGNLELADRVALICTSHIKLSTFFQIFSWKANLHRIPPHKAELYL